MVVRKESVGHEASAAFETWFDLAYLGDSSIHMRAA